MEAKIELREIHKAFGTLKILKGVNLSIQKGESVVIIGESGSGKSVTLKHVCGLIWPDKGQVFFDNEDITFTPELDMPKYRIKMGMLFQNAALFDSLTVAGNIAFGMLEHGSIDQASIPDKISETLRMVGLPGVEDKIPSELSGGMRKRVGLARAIAMNPEVMLYDEPTTGLDPIMSDVINDLIISTQEKLGVTSLTVTHDMKSAAKIADRIVMLYQGRIIAEGPPEEMMNSDHPIVRQFILGEAEGPITSAQKAL